MSPAFRPFAALLCLALVLAASPALQAKSADDERAEIRGMRDKVLAELYRLHPKAQDKIKAAKGYAVFSNVGLNVFFVSVAGGHGLVVKNGLLKKQETFMKMGSAGVGLGLGVKDFRAVFIFTDADKLDAFITKGWDFSAQADAAAKSDEKGAAKSGAGSVSQGVEIYQITKNGLALQATLQGTKYWKDRDLN